MQDLKYIFLLLQVLHATFTQSVCGIIAELLYYNSVIALTFVSFSVGDGDVHVLESKQFG